MLRLSCSVVNIDGLWPPSASHSFGSLDLSLACSWTLSLALLLFYSLPLPLCNFVPLRPWSHAIRLSSYRALTFSCCHAVVLSSSHTIMLAWHHAAMLSCAHNRGVIMLLHFLAPTPACPHAPTHLQSLTCRETLPHCLASRSLIVQVLKNMFPPRRNAHF